MYERRMVVSVRQRTQQAFARWWSGCPKAIVRDHSQLLMVVRHLPDRQLVVLQAPMPFDGAQSVAGVLPGAHVLLRAERRAPSQGRCVTTQTRRYLVDRPPNGERVRRASGTAKMALAQEFHDRIKSDLWRIVKLGEEPQRTWNEAAVKWRKERSHRATAKEDKAKLRWLDLHLGGKELDAINRTLIVRITDAKLAGV